MSKLFVGIEHVAVAARDSKRLCEFYCTVLGFRLQHVYVNGPGKQDTYFVHLNQNYIEIIQSNNDMPPRANNDRGLSHLAILVSDFDAAVEHVNASGAPREGDERAGPWGSRIQFYRDPEGNLFHLLWRPSPL